MRVSSITRPSSRGTLKSTRMKMRRSFSSRSRMESLGMDTESGLQSLAADEINQVADAAGISPFVVVPGNHFDAVAGDYQRHRSIHDGRARVSAKIGRDQFLFL